MKVKIDYAICNSCGQDAFSSGASMPRRRTRVVISSPGSRCTRATKVSPSIVLTTSTGCRTSGFPARFQIVSLSLAACGNQPSTLKCHGGLDERASRQYLAYSNSLARCLAQLGLNATATPKPTLAEPHCRHRH